MSITSFPTPKRPELLIGPFEESPVVLDGRVIPLLTGRRLEGGRYRLTLDNRFGGEFGEDEIWQVAALVANALAIGQGYPSYAAESKDTPFAPHVANLAPATQHDMHGGYGLCTGLGKVWVDDGEASNWYDQGTCPRCSPTPKDPQ